MSHPFWFSLLIIFYAAVSSYGLYLIKAAQNFQSLSFVFGAFCYAAGFAIWLVILRMFPLSIAFPTAAGAMIIATQITGILFLKEQTHLLTTAGIVLVTLGIALISVNMVKTSG